MIGLTTEREVLYQRINQRVDLMMDQGLIEEAKAVLQYPETQAAKGIGYKEFLPYFQGRPHWRRPLSKSSKTHAATPSGS